MLRKLLITDHWVSPLCSRLALGSGAVLLVAAAAWADSPPANDQIDVGIFTAVEGKVAVTHPGLQKSIPAKIQGEVLFKDVIETGEESRSKALLNDDSILTVGEHSRVEVTEHIFDPSKGVRSVVLNLVKGKLRALVGKAFTGSGSKFEIHTPTAVAAARGTYFVVFHINGVSGINNIGTHGHVDFSSGGRTVPVPPGHFSITPPGGGAPAPPAVNTGGNVPTQVANAVQATEVKETPKEESPKQMAMASGGTAPVPSSPSNLTGSGPGTTSTTSSSGSTSSSTTTSTPSATTSPTTTTTTTTTTVVVQIPAVTSGAAPSPPPPSPPPPPPLPPSGGDTGGDTGSGGGGGGETTPTPQEVFTVLTTEYLNKVTNSTETFKQVSDQSNPESLNEHATNLVRQVLNASETYLTETQKLSNEVFLTQAQTTTTTETTKAVTLVEAEGFKVAFNPLVVEPVPPPRVALYEWFVSKVKNLIAQFDESVQKANTLEERLIAKAESDYEKRVRDAEWKEYKKTEDAIEHAEKQIKQAEDRYEKMLRSINDPVLRAQAEAAKQAEIDAIQAKLADNIGNAKAELKQAIELARVTRAEALEIRKVDRAGDKLIGVPQKGRAGQIGQVGEEYLAKLRKEGVSQAVLDQAEHDIRRALADAERKVLEAQKAAVMDDIVRKTGQIGEEREFGRRFWRFKGDHENFNRRHRWGERFRHEREYVERRNNLRNRQYNDNERFGTKKR